MYNLPNRHHQHKQNKTSMCDISFTHSVSGVTRLSVENTMCESSHNGDPPTCMCSGSVQYLFVTVCVGRGRQKIQKFHFKHCTVKMNTLYLILINGIVATDYKQYYYLNLTN